MNAKFPSRKAEDLYSQDPNDQVGNSSDGVGWAGLYLNGSEEGGDILVENTDGSVDHHVYKTEEHLMKAWAAFEESLEIRHPNSGDLIVTDDDLSEYRVFVYEGEESEPRLLPGFYRTRQQAVEAAVDHTHRRDEEACPDIYLRENGKFFLMEV